MEETNQFKVIDSRFVYISISSIEAIKEFVSTVTNFACDVTLCSGRYIVDAKSIMGIFSLDLSKPLVLKINSTDENEIADVLGKIERFIVRD